MLARRGWLLIAVLFVVAMANEDVGVKILNAASLKEGLE